MDDVHLARTATDHLLGLGHTKIAHVGGWEGDTPPFPTPRDRFLGYTQALTAAGITPDPTLHVFGRWTVTGGSTAMDQLLDLPVTSRPTAVFAASDEMAIGALASARHHGLRVPQRHHLEQRHDRRHARESSNDRAVATLRIPPMSAIRAARLPQRTLRQAAYQFWGPTRPCRALQWSMPIRSD